MNPFFTMNPEALISCLQSASSSILLITPGIDTKTAEILVNLPDRLSIALITRLEEDTFRKGYGDFEAFLKIKDSTIRLYDMGSINIGLLIIDAQLAYIFVPVPLAISDMPVAQSSQNAMVHQGEWVSEFYRDYFEILGKLDAGEDVILQDEKVTIIGIKDTIQEDLFNKLPIPSIIKPSQRNIRSIDNSKVQSISQSIERNPIQSYDLTKRLKIYTNKFQYIEMSFENSRPQNLTVNLDKVLVIRDYPKEIVDKFKIAFRVFNNIKHPQTKKYTERLNEIKHKYVSSITNRGNVYLIENKALLENELIKLNAFISETKEEFFKSLYSEVELTIDTIMKEISSETIASYRKSIDMLIYYSDEHVREDIKYKLRSTLFSKIDEIIHKIAVRFYYKDITYEDITDPEFLNHLKTKFKDIDWNKLDPMIESLSVQAKEKQI